MKKRVREMAAMLPEITLDERMCPADCVVTVEVEVEGRFTRRHDCKTWQDALNLLQGIECQYYDIKLVKVGSRWAAVTHYSQSSTSGRRDGYWAVDTAGGYGVSNRSPEEAIDQCHQPRTYPTQKAVMAAVREDREMWLAFC